MELEKESKSEPNKLKKTSYEYIVNYYWGRYLYNLIIKIFSSNNINANNPTDPNKNDEIDNKL